jgi:hypothetical protein
VPVCGQAQPAAHGAHDEALASGCHEPGAHSVGAALAPVPAQAAPGGQP